MNLYSLSEITHLITDGKHGDCENELNSGYYFLSSKDLRDSKLHYDDAREIKYDNFMETHRRTKLDYGDILLANCGASIGRIGIAQKDIRIKKTTFQKSISVIKANKIFVNSKYLYCFLFYNSKYLIDLGRGTAQPNLLISDLKKIKILLPKIEIQKKIASILSAYDDLIENNNKRIAILEKMAEELYREWFVRLRFPEHEKTKIVKGIPEGWEIKNIGDIIKFQKGKNPDRFFIEKTEDLDIYLSVDAIENKNYLYSTKLKSILCDEDETLMLMDGARSSFIFNGQKGIVSSTFAVIRTNIKYRQIIHEYFKANLESMVSNNTGSAIPHANKNFIIRMCIKIPTNNYLIEKFNKKYKIIVDQVKILKNKNTILKKSREKLLSRLMSGKIDVENLDIHFPPSMKEEN